jgi:hypothetical protein
MKKRKCNQFDYNIDCEKLETRIENIFCLNDTLPDLSQICKTECPQGYFYDTKCKECPINEYILIILDF